MIHFFSQLIVIAAVNGFVMFGVVEYFPEFGLNITVPSVLLGYFLIWFVFWFFFVILKKMIDIVAFPFKFFTMGLSTVVVNIWVFYLFAHVVNTYLPLYYPGVLIQLGSVWQTFLLSIVLGVVMSVLHFIVKKII